MFTILLRHFKEKKWGLYYIVSGEGAYQILLIKEDEIRKGGGGCCCRTFNEDHVVNSSLEYLATPRRELWIASGKL